MYTYQDLLKVPDREQPRMDFVRQVIQAHKGTDLYKQADIADSYDKGRNVTIMQYQKLLYTVTGKAVPDNYSANYKMRAKFFNRFVTQENQYLLGKGITWEDTTTADKLGNNFEDMVQKAGKNALVHGVAFGFWNYDHLETFSLLEFAPLYDEENGALMAGVRFWQIDSTKPLRATFYELDGYTQYAWEAGKGKMLAEKRPYVLNIVESEIDGERIYDGWNYPSFPIVPLWGNPHKQSELEGLRENIDAYDLIKSGFANDIDDASAIYWTINNAGGMDDVDLVQFVERMKTVRAAVVDDEKARAEAHTMDVPTNARETILNRLRKDLYEDYMALDTKEIAGGAVTATQIRAAYEPMDDKADQYEYQICQFIKGILELAGIEDIPTFTRSRLVNVQEEVSTVLQAAQYLDSEYVTRKILTLLGDGEQADEVLKRMDAESMARFNDAALAGGYEDESE